MKKLLITLLAFAALSWGQCGHLAYNPVTGLMDCVGVSSGGTSVGKVTITQPATSATLTLVDGSSLITAGAHAITLTSTADSTVTLPTSGTLAARLTGTGTIDFGSISDGTCASSTFTLTGAVTGDNLAPAWPSTLNTGLFGTMLVTAGDTVTVRVCNLSGSAVDPASATFGAAVIR